MSIKELIIEKIEDSEQIVFIDGFDEAIIGMNIEGTRVCYSFIKAIEVLERNMTNEEALYYFYFNLVFFDGKNMPIWVYDFYA